MPSKRRPAASADTAVVRTAVPNTNPAHPITENSCLKFTYSCKADNESLTIRTDSESELEELIARWKFRVISKREPKAKMNDGDQCQICEGFMTTKVGTNRKTGKEYQYLRCSNFPKCNFSAYIVQQPATEPQAA